MIDFVECISVRSIVIIVETSRKQLYMFLDICFELYLQQLNMEKDLSVVDGLNWAEI